MRKCLKSRKHTFRNLHNLEFATSQNKKIVFVQNARGLARGGMGAAGIDRCITRTILNAVAIVQFVAATWQVFETNSKTRKAKIVLKIVLEPMSLRIVPCNITLILHIISKFFCEETNDIPNKYPHFNIKIP